MPEMIISLRFGAEEDDIRAVEKRLGLHLYDSLLFIYLN